MLLQRVRRFVRQHDLIRPGTRVVCALSGGSDSVALAHILAELDAANEAKLVGFVHLNHQLRATADRDEQFCRELAEQLHRPLTVDREDVAARARTDRQSIEVAARSARYAAFARAQAQLDADVLALGHTKDDQAETFLLRMIRGAGPRGLASMYPRNGDIIRPLLECTRAELRDYLGSHPFVEDETNDDLAIPRNRVRETLLPLLASEFNPNIVDVLAREAELARDVWSWLESELTTFGADLHVEDLKGAPLALRRLAVWRAMLTAADGRPVGFEHVDAALALLDARDGARVDAPGHRVQRKGGRLVLTQRGSKGAAGSQGSEANLFCYPLSIPGEVVDSQRGFAVSVEPGTAASADVRTASTAVVRRDLIGNALAVRNRRRGDRFTPVGLHGRKKLQDYFVDRKIARETRDFVPIVVDERDRIVWVAGHGIDEAFRVTDASQAVLILKFKAVGGFA